MVRTIAVMALAASAATTTALAASSFFGQFFPVTGRVSDCYTRGYDAAHMAAHPQQRVTSFALDHAGDEPADPRGPEGFVVNFSFAMKGINDAFAGTAACREQDGSATCVAGNGAGSFALAAAGKNISLTVGSSLRGTGWRTGSANVSPDLAVGGDDRVFLLVPNTQQACKAAGAG